MERTASKRPGYDCMHAPCAHTPKGDHGIYPEEWWYVIKDGDRAVSTFLVTALLPPTVPDWKWRDRSPRPGAVAWHRAWRESEYDSEGDCDYLAGGKCYSDVGYTIADEVWKHGDPLTFEQGEEFWRALAALLPERPAADLSAGAGI